MGKIRRIILFFDASRAPNQAYIRGITKYSHIHGPWLFQGLPSLYQTGNYHYDFRENKSFQEELAKADAVFGYLPENISNKIISLGKPAVYLQLTRKEIPGLVNIMDEIDSVGKLGANYFLELGFKNFAFCGWNIFHWSLLRCEGFCKRVSESGFTAIVYEEDKNSKIQTLEQKRQQISDWLKSLPKPVGVMTCNDDLSREVAQACIMAGLRVPDEVAILGVDNDEMVCNLTLPPLTSILLNHEIIGYEAGKQLDRLMSGKKASEYTLFIKPIHIVKRQSTDILAIEDEDVVSAIRFILSNSDRQISVADVANETTLSTRVLQSRFRKILNRSIHQEIRRARIERFSKMLLETNNSIYQIAMTLDFRDVNHVARAFRKETGMTPLQYRKKYENQ